VRVVVVAVVAAVAGLVGLASGCGGGSPGSGSGSVTYYRDVLPVVTARCGGCHEPGGLAPFSLVSYDEAHPRAGLLAASTRAGEMPPWLPAEGCGDFEGSRRLSAAEIAIFEAWADGGAPAGAPTDAPPSAPTASDLGPPGATLDPGASYQANRPRATIIAAS